jgi:regulator of chromosome condensation
MRSQLHLLKGRNRRQFRVSLSTSFLENWKETLSMPPPCRFNMSEKRKREDSTLFTSKKIKTENDNGYILSFGSGGMGQLGLGCERKKQVRKIPTCIPALQNHQMVSIATGGIHSAAIEKDGTLWSWGCNDEAALGRLIDKEEWIPISVGSTYPCFVQVACGASHTMALTNQGEIYTWGTYRNNQGSVGFHGRDKQAFPLVLFSLHVRIHRIACGEHHDLVLTDQGNVYDWGILPIEKTV